MKQYCSATVTELPAEDIIICLKNHIPRLQDSAP